MKHGTQGGYGRGCRCADCTVAHREAVRFYLGNKRARERHGGRASDSSVLTCKCGGLLAETDDNRVFCLTCEGVPA